MSSEDEAGRMRGWNSRRLATSSTVGLASAVSAISLTRPMEGGIDWLTLALGDTQCPTIKKQVRSLLPCGSGELSIPNPTPSLTSSSASLPSSTLETCFR